MSLPIVLLALQVAAAAAPALTASEQRYVDARNAANARFSKADPAGGEQDRVLNQLTHQLREIIGPVSLAGVDGPGKAAYDGFEGVGSTEMADGLVFDWRGSRLFVTTRSLSAHAAAATRRPLDRPVDDAMFTFTVFSDAAYTTFAELPVRRRSSTELARASVGLVAQDIGPWPPNALVVQVVRGDRVYLVGTLLSPERDQVPSCDQNSVNTTGFIPPSSSRRGSARSRNRRRLRRPAPDAARSSSRCAGRSHPGACPDGKPAAIGLHDARVPG